MKTMMKKPAVKKPALKKFAAGGAVAKKPVKKYAAGGTVEMQNMTNQGLTMQQMQESRARQQAQAQQAQQMQQAAAPKQFNSFGPIAPQMPVQTQANMMPAGTRAGPSAPEADAALIQAAQQMARDKAMAAAKKQSQQPIPAAQRVADFRKQQAMKASGRFGMAKGGAVTKKAVTAKGKKK